MAIGGVSFAGHVSAVAYPRLAEKIMVRVPHTRALARTYQVKAGQGLSAVAQRVYGHAAWWPELYWRNKDKIRNATSMTIYAGQRLTVPVAWRHQPRVPHVYRPVSAVAAVRATTAPSPAGSSVGAAPAPGGGTLSFAGLEQLWESAGGPASAAAAAATIAECESGGNQFAHNPSGASGYWQILGQVVPGYIYDPMVNARNAVSKFEASGGTFAQWVCTAAKVKSPHRAIVATLTAAVQPAVHKARHGHRRLAAWRWALKQHYKWYAWGGTGPSVFDCSGLVMQAWRHAGVSLPRTTESMIASGRLTVVTGHPQRGDLAFFGSGHVELYDKPGWTYGAHHSGTQIGYRRYNSFWHPTLYMRIS